MSITRLTLPVSPSILIVLTGSLGDVTRGLCLPSCIKKSYPQSKIAWLIDFKWAELVKFHPLLDQVITFNRLNWKKGLKETYQQLKRNYFDCTFDLQRHFKSGIFSFLSGARYRIGFHPNNAKEGNWLFNNIYIPYMNEKSYPKIYHYLKYVEIIGGRWTKALDFGFSNLQLYSIAPHLFSRLDLPYIAVVLGSTWDSKEWFFDRYFHLIYDLLEETPYNIVLIDSRSKYEMALSLEQKINSFRLLNLVGQTTVLELTGVLKEAMLAVGPDCGSAHVASAVKTPYVSLFGPTSPKRTAPYGSEHLVVNSPIYCAPCYKRDCPRQDKLCMRSIQVEEVKKKIFQSLHQYRNVK